MIKSSINIFILFFIFLNSIYTESPVYFSYAPTNQVYDYRSGNNLEHIDDFRNIKNKNKIERLIVTISDSEEKQFYELLFKNGLLKTEISHVHDLNKENYEYDDKKRLIKGPDGFSYNYISDNNREYFYYDEKKRLEEVFEDNSFMKIKINNYTNSFVTNGSNFIPTGIVEDGHDEQEFYYNEDGNLIHFLEHSWNFKGIKSEYSKEIQFYYNNEKKIEKIVSGYENDIRYISYIFYDKYGNMERIIEKNILSNNKKEIFFSDYDKYGNWHKCQTVYYDKTTKNVIREIFYEK